MENWLEWRAKLIQLAQLESATRPLIRKLLRRIDEFDELQYPEVCLVVCTILKITTVFYRCQGFCLSGVTEQIALHTQSQQTRGNFEAH